MKVNDLISVPFETELERLLAEDCDSIKFREQTTFDQLAGEFRDSLVIFGTGGLAQRTLTGLRQLGIQPLAFADNNPQRWKTTIEEIPVLAPEDAVQTYGDRAVFIVAIWSDQVGHPVLSIRAQLEAYGTVTVLSFASLYWKYSEVFLPYFGFDLPHRICSDLDEVRRAAELWDDELSQELFLAQLRWRLWLDADSIVLMDSYSRPGALYDRGVISTDDVIVDCGAFDGDTLRSIMEGGAPFSKIVAIEPDPANCEKLRNYVASLPEETAQKVFILPFAAGAHREKLRFASSGSMQSAISAEGNIEVESAPLDDIAYEYAPTYIKFDIEGAEPEALEGSRQILADFAPRLAVSVYHKFDHLWKLPLQMKQLAGNYTLSLYPAAKAGWDFMCLGTPPHKERIKF